MSSHTIRLAELVAASTAVSATRSRRKKVELLSECLANVEPCEIGLAVKYLSGDLPQGKIGLGFAAIRKALSIVADAEASATSLELSDVDGAFEEIAATQGKGASTRRIQRFADLLAATDETCQTFLVNLVAGEIRQGALEGIMTEAAAQVLKLNRSDVRRAVMLSGDLGRVVTTVTHQGVAALHEFSLELFRPLQPMLAEPTEGVEAALDRLGTAALEYKLDGVRVQVHKQNDTVRVYTRHLKEITERVPEVVELARSFRDESIILDGEVLAFRADGRPHAFQTTMKRLGRTRNVSEMQERLPLSILFFDCLMINGQPLIDESTRERHEALSDCVADRLIVPRMVCGDSIAANNFLAAAMEAGHEGIMAKSLEAEYAAGGRGQSWLKIKPAHTLDLVVIAAEWGSGRRKGWLSNLHLAARDDSSGEFVMIGKTFKGLTDKTLAWQTQELLQLESHRQDHIVFAKPSLVVEVAFNEIQRSSQYDSGFALRFARVKRYRSDKQASEADSIQTVAKIFAKQYGRPNNTA